MAQLGIAEMAVQQLVVENRADRLQRIMRAWAHYDGIAPKPLELSDDGYDDNVRLNLAELIVNKGATALMGSTDHPVAFQIEGDEAGTVLEVFEQEWPEEQRNVALHQLAVNGGITGHAILRLHRNPTRVVVIDPSNFDADWDDEDIETVLRYKLQWTAYDSDTGEAYARRQRIEPLGGIWIVYDERSYSDGDEWTEIGQERWPFPWPPVFECQHLPSPNEFYGRAVLENHVMDLAESIEAVLSEMRRIVRHYGHPIPWVTGESAKNMASLETAIGHLLAFPNKDARVGQLELAAKLDAIVLLYREMRQAFHEITRIPEVASGKLENAGALSGVALSILYGPLVELGSTLRLTYGPMLSSLVARILELVGKRDQIVSPQWPTIVPEDRDADATRDETELRMGIVSKQTISERRGYDWQEEQRRMQGEAQAAAQAMVDAFNKGAGGALPPGTPPAAGVGAVPVDGAGNPVGG